MRLCRYKDTMSRVEMKYGENTTRWSTSMNTSSGAKEAGVVRITEVSGVRVEVRGSSEVEIIEVWMAKVMVVGCSVERIHLFR